MLEIKPLTSADHFTHPIQPISAVGRVKKHHVPTPEIVTISSAAAKISAAMQRQTTSKQKTEEDPKKSFKQKINEVLERLKIKRTNSS